MEKKTEKLRVSNELRAFLGSGLVQYGEDVLNSEVSRHDIIVQLLISQKNNVLGIQKMQEDKQKQGIKLNEKTIAKFKRFMSRNRFSPLLGGGWKSEEEVINYLLDVGLKLGKNFLDKLSSSDNFSSVTSTMKNEVFEDEKNRRKAVAEALEKGDGENGC